MRPLLSYRLARGRFPAFTLTRAPVPVVNHGPGVLPAVVPTTPAAARQQPSASAGTGRWPGSGLASRSGSGLWPSFEPGSGSSSGLGSRPERNRALLLLAALAVAIAHPAAMAFLAHPAVASNLLQVLAPALAAAVCGYEAWRASTRHQRRLWLQLSLSFLLWTAAQSVFLSTLFLAGGPGFDLASDILWLAFSFPMLIVAANPAHSRRADPVAWLDAAQSCLLFAILFVLVYPHPGILRAPLAYHVENIAMLLALLLRYSIAQPGEERLFYRNATAFAALYSATSLLSSALSSRGVHPGTFVDLCWSLPFTFFCVLALARPQTGPQTRFRLPGRVAGTSAGRLSFPQHLHGASALGMAVMALAGAAVLARHSLSAGLPVLGVAFLLFAARTSMREWQLHAAHGRLEHSVLHDPLTGLANRCMVQRELTAKLAGVTAQARRRPALLFTDLDRFKTINDGLGHSFGDRLLVEVASRLQHATCTADLVARHGGDEFVILLADVDEREAEQAARRVTAALRIPFEIDGHTVHVTASTGIVLGQPGATAESMLQDADCAMYKAKAAGRDRAQAFDPTMLEAAKHRLALETDLREALENGGIEVHYQPLFAVEDRSIRGFEALVRWRHPERGMVSPAEFIPVAEDSGLVIELGRQVFRQACHQCQAWHQRFGGRLGVAVNFSVHQFSEPGLAKEIADVLADSGLDPAQLKMEITESVLINNYQAVADALEEVRAMGIRVCLDDFGTGYSSLSYLLRFPFDVVKIDRSFIRGLDSDPRQAELVRMIIELARLLDKKTVAEGVETEAELACLREFGCDMVQGFLLARPMPAEAVTAMLASGAFLPSTASAPQPLRIARLPVAAGAGIGLPASAAAGAGNGLPATAAARPASPR